MTLFLQSWHLYKTLLGGFSGCCLSILNVVNVSFVIKTLTNRKTDGKAPISKKALQANKNNKVLKSGCVCLSPPSMFTSQSKHYYQARHAGEQSTLTEAGEGIKPPARI